MTTSNERHVPMQVLSLGMSRTGTATMKAALQILGHKQVHHAYELYTHPQQCWGWIRAWDAKVGQDKRPFGRTEWDQLLGDYSAVTDMPAACFATELIDAYPEAKVVLVQREPELWYKSFKSGVIDTYWDNCFATTAMGILDPQLLRPVDRFWARLFGSRDGFFKSGSRSEMQANALGVYHEHNASVKAAASTDRLLEFDLGDGWGPLCAFLGVGIPDEPFPRVNEGDAVKQVVGDFVQRGLLNCLRNVWVAVVIVGCTIRFIRKLG